MGTAFVIATTPVLVPGNMCDGRLWTADVRAALPGAVDADTTADSSIEGMARRALVLNDGPLLPIGYSMGGNVALEIARIAPERVNGLVLIDINASADLPDRAKARPRQQGQALGGELERLIVEELKPNYLAHANRSNQRLLELLLRMALELGEAVFVAQSEALRTRRDLREVAARLDVPVLVACGSEDRLCPPAWHRELAESARRATLKVIDGAGHMLPLEQPKKLAAAIGQWRMP